MGKAKKTGGEVLKECTISIGKQSYKIFVTKEVENTAEVAVAVNELLSPNKRIILLASSYHMHRVKWLSEKEGFEEIHCNVDYKACVNNQVLFKDFLPSDINLELNETDIREIISRIYYIIKGKLTSILPHRSMSISSNPLSLNNI